MTDDEVKETCEFIETEREDVNISWSDMTSEERDAEIRAAMRCSFVIAAVEADSAIHLITEADMLARDPNTSAGRSSSKESRYIREVVGPKGCQD